MRFAFAALALAGVVFCAGAFSADAAGLGAPCLRQQLTPLLGACVLGIAVGVAALLCFARCRALGAARCNAAGHLRDALLVLPLLGGARQGWG